MTGRRLSALLGAVLVVGAAAWLGGRGYGDRRPAGAWTEVAPGVLRSPGLPVGYALVDGDAALLIDAPVPADGLRARGIQKVDAVLLTHHHRDSCAAAGAYLAAKVPVRAARESADWLEPDKVAKYWQESLPL